ncbi:MAG: hypothetical protein Q4A75_06610, partial [Peptostreptococcaceae bacterium]|nr:hypothetical protein [Peptostreptococcaceae bacterium]
MKKNHQASFFKTLFVFFLCMTIIMPYGSMEGYAAEPTVFELDLGGTIHKLEAKADGGVRQITGNISWNEQSKTLSFDNYTGTYVVFKGPPPHYRDRITFHFTGENRLIGRKGNTQQDKDAALITYYQTTLTGAPNSKLIIAPLASSQTHVVHGISANSSLTINGDLSVDIKGSIDSTLWGIHSPNSVLIQSRANVSVDVFSGETREVYGFANGIDADSLTITTSGKVKLKAASRGAYAHGIAAGKVAIRGGEIDIEVPPLADPNSRSGSIRLHDSENIILGENMIPVVGTIDNRRYGGKDPYHTSWSIAYNKKGHHKDHAEIRFASEGSGELVGNTVYSIRKGSPWNNSYIIAPTPKPNEGYLFDRWEPTLPSNGLVINDNMIFTAHFKKDEKYSSDAEIRFVAGRNGELKGNTTFKIKKGTRWGDADITIPGGYPAKGYRFAGWSPRLPYRSEEIKESMVFTAQFKTDLDYPTPAYIYFYGGSNGKLKGETNFVTDAGTAWAVAVPKVPEVVPDIRYRFAGWDNPLPDPHSAVSSSLTFYATYEEDPHAEVITIRFNSSEHGYVLGSSVFELRKGTKWKDADIEIPGTEPKDGYQFTGWEPAIPGPEEILNTSRTFTAKFVKEGAPAEKVNVTFTAGTNGTLSGTTNFTVDKGTLWKNAGITLPTPQPAQGYRFDKWTPALPSADSPINASQNYVASFVKLPAEKVTVTFTAG